MEQVIKKLKSTTFAGKRFTRKQLRQIQETVKALPHLSRHELANTICEHLQWFTTSGSNKVSACLKALEIMEVKHIIQLPKKILSQQRGPQKEIVWTNETKEQSKINCPLAELRPIRLVEVDGKEHRSLWNEFIDRYHYLGYKRPIGSHIRYFIVDRHDRRLGCLLFSLATKVLPCRDQWIGWDDKSRDKRLDLIINNNRFLIFPWVSVKCLASNLLSIATDQVAQDWRKRYNYRPVMMETYVDSNKYKGTCYQAANWQCIGKTIGRKATKNTEGRTQKDIYMRPLRKNSKSLLRHGEKKTARPIAQVNNHELAFNDPFIALWQKIIGIVNQVANDCDREWQRRKRVLNTMLIILFIFRLVFSKNNQGYSITIAELWDQCRRMNMPLPQYKPVTASAFCEARKKIDENIFKVINSEVIQTYNSTQDDCWYDHRVFAVDGTKINLPKSLEKLGFSKPSSTSYYPCGLVSCLYRLQLNIPVDFDLASHKNERKAALTHLKALEKNDLVVYDRGYFSYAMLHIHISAGFHVVFRLQKSSMNVIDEFMRSDEVDKIVDIQISTKQQQKYILSQYPQIKEYKPLTLRLIKYVHDQTEYILGTTLIDSQKYPSEIFSNLYHARWGIEELYKISKSLIDVEDFHSKTERGVKQELFAHFVLITLSRIFTNKTDDDLNEKNSMNFTVTPNLKTNFKNSLITVARYLEGLFIKQAEFVKHSIIAVFNSLMNCRQKVRPNRSYARRSRKTIKKWQPSRARTAT